MPNHIHLLLDVERFSESLARDGVSRHIVTDIVGNLKKYTAHKANKILNRSGRFWQHESYDHVVRDGKEFNQIVSYILNNPVAAGLAQNGSEWKWSYCKEEYL